MWTFFENGTFYSAVVDRDDTDVMWVRSRDERSAKILADWAGVDVVVRENADYLYRVSLNRETWIEYVTVQMNSAKATNFKSEVGRNVEGETGRSFLDALHEVWGVMYGHQRREKMRKSGSKSKGRTSAWGYATVHDSVDDDWEMYDAWEHHKRGW